MAVCIFCGRKGRRSHVFRKAWIKSLVPAGGKFVTEIGLQGNDPSVFSTGDLELAVNDVCDPCDSRWVDQLDHKAEKVLNDLLTGEQRMISASEKLLLATWASKTAAFINCLVPEERRSFTKADLARIKDEESPPERIDVWIAGCGYHDPIVGTRHVRLAPDVVDMRRSDGMGGVIEGKPLLPAGDHAYVATFRIYHLCFQVFVPKLSPDLAPQRTASWDRVLGRLWPLDLQPLRWPLDVALPHERAFVSLAESFGGRAERPMSVPVDHY